MKLSILSLAALSGLAAVVQAAPPAKKPVPAPQKAPAPQKVTISLPDGYKNGAATVQAGRPVALTFFLKSEAGCGNTIVVPAAKWKRSLKIGQQATLLYTPKKSGPLAFECGMGMDKGSLTVK